VGERSPDTREVTGSIPVATTHPRMGDCKWKWETPRKRKKEFTLSELTDYKTKAAKTLARIAQTVQMRSVRVTEIASMLGLPAISVDGKNVKVAEVKEPDEFHGVPRADLTATAIAKYEAAALATFKRDLFAEIGYLYHRNDYMPLDLVSELLSELGLPVPVTVTRVSAFVTGQGNVSFTLPGEHKVADIRAKLEAMADTPVSDMVVAAFPGATNTGDRVSDLRVHPRTEWPEYKD
jgi:hypothetical protein